MALASLALAVAGGCTTPTEGDRQVNHQNKLAAQVVVAALKRVALALSMLPVGSAERSTAEGALVEAGAAAADIEANSERLEKNLIGPPAEKQPYSPQASQEARDQSTQDHSDSWLMTGLKGAVGLAIGWLGRGGFIRLFGLIFPTVAAGPLGAGLALLTSGIARVREQAKTNGGAISIEGEGGLLKILEKEATANPAAHALIRELAHKAEAKLAAKL